ncbi:unnamed protein product [Tuber aestivum]|uniref:Uncharacterized protein n=1 Tax=Tuber aestivum TaxID=59557 RepID=A0A292PUK2_9PEZI|nr:unnamed protein product [Tuber aestivum]
MRCAVTNVPLYAIMNNSPLILGGSSCPVSCAKGMQLSWNFTQLASYASLGKGAENIQEDTHTTPPIYRPVSCWPYYNYGTLRRGKWNAPQRHTCCSVLEYECSCLCWQGTVLPRRNGQARNWAEGLGV